MAINPPSDIVLEVVRAADPLQYSAAVEKLARIGASDEADAGFDLLLGSINADLGSSIEQAPDWTRADLRSRLTPLGARIELSPSVAPYRQFEAFVLQTFIQSMLPKDASHVYGEGIAGSYWGSMLAEGIAAQMAKSGGIGIAAELAAKRPASVDAASGQGALFDGRSGHFGPDTVPSASKG